MADIKHRIGIMGGTFDPIHMGHLILGEKAYEQFRLEKVLFMPSGNPPHKRNRQGRATDEERVEMVRRAITGNPHFELSLTEMHENGYTYTCFPVQRCAPAIISFYIRFIFYFIFIILNNSYPCIFVADICDMFIHEREHCHKANYGCCYGKQDCFYLSFL